MGLFGKIFSKKERPKEQILTQELSELMELDNYMGSLLRGDHYVSRKEFKSYFESKSPLIEWFNVLKSSGTLDTYCDKYGMSLNKVNGIISKYDSFESLIDSQNNQYVKMKMIDDMEYLDNILKDTDSNIVLDDNQREVVLSDEDYSLVIAGAGAGKTTTVAAKVKYLVDKQGIDPKQILVISFTNKAVDELRKRINKDLQIYCPIATFHSTGNAILHINTPQELNIVDRNKLYYVVRDYFRNSVLKNETVVKDLIMFFATYFDAPYDEANLSSFFNHIAKANYTSMKSELDEFKIQVVDAKTKRSETILSEIMRSRQEVEIANYLYLNGIDYEYEPLYRYNILYAHKPYTPDFLIKQGNKEAYLEHFGITEDGENDRYSYDELATYKKAVNDKIILHRNHNTKLIYTFSAYKDKRPLIDHLKELLEENGFELRQRANKEIIEKLVMSEENRYIKRLVILICRFIANFKINGYTTDEFDRMYHSTQNVRTRLFLNICQDCFVEYQRYLKDNDAVDFEDMINESARVLREVKEMKRRIDFKYVIVDEYQDISKQRFDLVRDLSEATDAKIIAVGDDWQSIYAFSGSDITLFTKFSEKVGYAKLHKIVRTYRNSQEVIDIAGGFIQKNKEQIEKDLISKKHINDPVIIYTYDGTRKKRNADNKSGVNYEMAHAVETALEQIIKYNEIEGKPKNSSILLLGRYAFDGDMLEKSGLFEYVRHGNKIKSVKYPFLNISFMTVHSSKGLGYDNVIIVNGRNEIYGFPSKIEDDPVLSYVIKEDRSIDYAEERRLFYVALTRTKNRVYIIAPEKNPSEFLLEIKDDYKNVVLNGEWNTDPNVYQFNRKSCPICGYPMQLKYKPAFGLRLYICTNEPEICGYMTNDYKSGKLSVIKCDRCRDGYLIVKLGKEKEYVLGCTNYKKDGTGCSRLMSRKYFYDFMGIQNDEIAEPKKIIKGRDIKPKTSDDIKSYNDSAISDKTTNTVEVQKNNNTSRYIRAISIKNPDINSVLYKNKNLNSIIVTMLQCVSDVSEVNYYGVSTYLDIFRGSESKRALKADFDQLEAYGKLRYVKREDLKYIMEWLIKNGYLLQTKSYYPVLHPTYKGMHYNENVTEKILHKLKEELER